MERKSKYKSWSQRISFKVDKSGNKNLKCIKANTKKDISDWNQHAGEMRGRRRRKYTKCLTAHCCACVLSRFSRVQLFVTPWTVAHEAPLSMGFSRQEYWSRLPFPFQVTSQSRDQTQVSCTAGRFFTTWTTGKPSFKNNR